MKIWNILLMILKMHSHQYVYFILSQIFVCQKYNSVSLLRTFPGNQNPSWKDFCPTLPFFISSGFLAPGLENSLCLVRKNGVWGPCLWSLTISPLWPSPCPRSSKAPGYRTFWRTNIFRCGNEGWAPLDSPNTQQKTTATKKIAENFMISVVV